MKKLLVILSVILLPQSLLFSQDRTASFDANKMRERVKRLSADDFEGRGPGTVGGKRAAQYIAVQLKAGGVKPANGKSYFQNVKLVGVKGDPDTKLHTTGVDWGGTSLKFGDDLVATTGAQSDSVDLSAQIVFVGYGIYAPQYNWNDYKGDPERFKGKWLMILVNDPPATSDEPGLFGGKALTYYGRWTYKYEEAARRGAAGVILVHTTPSWKETERDTSPLQHQARTLEPTQLFINLGNNSGSLDDRGFAAFGKVIEGMHNVESINAEYGETPQQNRIEEFGNEYLKKSFPHLDYIKRATLVSESSP